MSRAWTDRYGTELAVGGEASFPACARLTVSKPCGVHLEAADFPALAGALYESAGLPVPVILDRPAVPSVSLLAGVTFTARHGGVDVGYHSLGTDSGHLCDPETIRRFAASLAILADEAEATPDPADVEELTGYLVRAGAGLRSTGVDEIARAALGWMAGRKQRGEADA